MASLSLYPQFETNLMSDRNVIELLLQLKNAKAHGKSYIKVRPSLIRPLLRNRLLACGSLLRSYGSSGITLVGCFLSRREGWLLYFLLSF